MQAAASPEAHVVRVERSWDETPAFRGIALAAPAPVLAAHRAPGQYLRVGTGPELDGMFALASGPNAGSLELLLKRGARAADQLAAVPEGAELFVSAPMGQGYPVAEHGGRDVLLFAAGSGIAPIRSVVQAIQARRADYGKVRLYYGQRTGADFAYRAEHDAWRASGIDVHLCCSQADRAWTGARGRVQDALIAGPPPLADAVAYLCGMKAMLESVTTILVELGLPRDRVFLNY
jgi:sulfhydrogenase subunit gamma (sulfur reductase)